MSAAPPSSPDSAEEFAVKVIEYAFGEGADPARLAREAAASDDHLAVIVEIIEDVSYLRALGKARGLTLPDDSEVVDSL
jgi:hypothetical protein